MNYQFDILKNNRLTILKIIENFSVEQLNKIPKGFNNNIGWNVAHLVVTHQLLCYNMSGIPMIISNDMVSKYRKGTTPKEDISIDEMDKIKGLFIKLLDQFELDIKKGIFKTYNAYTTSLNVTLTDIDSAFAFNNFHEGIHLGVILALRKLV